MSIGYPSTYNPVFDSYGTLRLTVTNPPQSFTEPLSLGEVKQYLRVDFDDDDALIASLISAAREQAELFQRRVLVRKQYDLTYDYWPGFRVELASPVVSVDLVQYTDVDGHTQELIAGPDYVADLTKQPAIISAPWNTCWPWFSPAPSSSILIRFTAGYGLSDPFWQSAGARLKAGMLLLVSHWYTNRLPFSGGRTAANEFPYGITACLLAGSLKRPR